MKTKAGFKYKITGLKAEYADRLQNSSINIFFKSFNEKITKCWVKDNAVDKTFLGTSKCNTQAGDEFDKDTGMSIALARALKKREEWYLKLFKRFNNANTTVNTHTNKNIMNKFESLLKKEKLSC
jgi:hypothetical protein